MGEKTICIGSDHRGYPLKGHLKKVLKSKGYNVTDVGCDSYTSCDYPELAEKVAKKVKKEGCIGILIDGTGIGMSIVANKFKGVYAALVYNEFSAKMARWHNNANIITIGATTTETKRAEIMVDTFLNTEFEGERHERRLKLIKNIEGEH